MKFLFGTWGAMVCYAPETGGVEGGEAGGDGGGAPASPALVQAALDGAGDQQVAGEAGDQDKTGDGDQMPASYFPDGVNDRYKGSSDRETIDKMAAELKDKPLAPDDPKDYKLDLGDDLAKKFGDMNDDPVLPMWREVAHELGLNDAQFNGALGKLYGKMSEAGMIDDPVNVAGELEALQPASGDPKSKDAAARQRVQAASDWVSAQVSREVLTESQGALVTGLAATADGVKAIEALMKAGGEHGLQGGGNPSPAMGDTKDSLKELMRSPKYDLNNPMGDIGFVTDVNARWRRLHGSS